MWLPRPIYESLPYAWILAGSGLLLGAFVLDGGPRNFMLLLGSAGVIAGLVFWMRRRDYRASQSEYDRGSLDD